VVVLLLSCLCIRSSSYSSFIFPFLLLFLSILQFISMLFSLLRPVPVFSLPFSVPIDISSCTLVL
jgi:hypothetical protein